jgi:hypothetical protein
MLQPRLDNSRASPQRTRDGQLSSTSGPAAVQTGRNPNRSGMTTVSFEGQGGGRGRTLASVLKTGGYQIFYRQVAFECGRLCDSNRLGYGQITTMRWFSA